jgi:tRNA (guanine-N7-)-methyltransferase
MMIGEKPEMRMRAPLRSFGRRKTKPLSARRTRLIEDLLPRLRIDLAKEAPSPLTALFPVPVNEVWLEIGFGAGEHLLWQTESHKEIGFIGCEPFINGMASLLGAIEDRGLATIRVYDGDAREVLAWLPAHSISRIFLLFPDPWPKKRHLKRRLLNSDTIGECARVLVAGGEFRFASDNGDYAAEALFLMRKAGTFAWAAERADDWRERPCDWPETRYGRKSSGEGRKAAYLTFSRL